jgi:hypothetical protein
MRPRGEPIELRDENRARHVVPRRGSGLRASSSASALAGLDPTNSATNAMLGFGKPATVAR